MSPTEYEFWGMTLPAYMIEALDTYVERGRLPGHFLTAVLQNDLKEACARADDVNRPILAAYVGYLYNECPAPCWGSPAKVATWSAEWEAVNDVSE